MIGQLAHFSVAWKELDDVLSSPRNLPLQRRRQGQDLVIALLPSFPPISILFDLVNCSQLAVELLSRPNAS